MIYENKIDWTKGSCDVLSSTRTPFKSAVLDYQIQVEGKLEDLIKRHFRDPKAYEVEHTPFRIKIKLARALIGKTPDDAIWRVIESLGDLRNKYAHSRFTETEVGKNQIQDMTNTIFGQLKSVWPEIVWLATPNQVDIITQAHFMVRRFFREINEELDKLGLLKSTQN